MLTDNKALRFPTRRSNDPLFLLGHACWAYVAGRLVARPLGVNPNFYLLLLLGMLPDIDLILGIFDVGHRTLTHSIVFWTGAFVPFFVILRRAALPYFVAVTQHILFGDLIVGRTPVFWPVSDLKLGLGLSLLSPITLVLEAIGLALLVVFVYKYREPSKKSPILQGIVLVPLIAFVVLASLGNLLPPVFFEGPEARHLERNLPALLGNAGLQIAVLLHLGLIAVILIPPHKISKHCKKLLQEKQT